MVERVTALGCFLATQEGGDLLAGCKRAANILRIEEKKEQRSFTGEVNENLLKEKEEKALNKVIQAACTAVPQSYWGGRLSNSDA